MAISYADIDVWTKTKRNYKHVHISRPKIRQLAKADEIINGKATRRNRTWLVLCRTKCYVESIITQQNQYKATFS